MKSEINQLLRQNKLDAIIISGAREYNPPLTYFIKNYSFTRAIIVLLQNSEPVLFYRPMERDNAMKTGLKSISLDDFPTAAYQKEFEGNSSIVDALQLRDILFSLGVHQGNVAFCGKLEFGEFYPVVEEFKKHVPLFHVKESDGIDILNQARYTKDADEIRAIENMGKIVTNVVGNVENYIRNCRLKDNFLVTQEGIPVTIGQIKKKINLWLSEKGAENPNGTIFSMGRDAAVPHNTGKDAAVLEAGKTIVFDFFPCENGGGYFYDFTRTWCIGWASEKIMKAYEQVKKVQDDVFSSIEVGLPLKELQKLTCKLFYEMGHETIEQNRLCKNGYVHSISHGLGLNIHERPFSGFTSSDADRSDIGTVFTIEPGVYYPDSDEPFGIRIEDTFTIDPDGKARKLAEYPYQLILQVPQYEEDASKRQVNGR